MKRMLSNEIKTAPKFVTTHIWCGELEVKFPRFSNIQIRQEPLKVALLRATCGQYSMSGREQGY